jgi:hypothetical protein
VWGGSCDLAQALWKIRETRSEAETARLLAKARVYLIALQDGTGQWLLDSFPNLYVIPAMSTWQGIFGSKDREWIDRHVRRDHGVLGAAYPSVAMGTAPGVKEGDSPSFLYLASAARGLNDPGVPSQPSWGGQFVRAAAERNHWLDAPASRETVSRWAEAFDNDFAARMDWCVRDFDEANHPPRVVAAGEARREVRPGATVALRATATDPDGDGITARWWHETTAELSSAPVDIERADTLDRASFVVPSESGRRVYVILEVEDDGAPPLVAYRRLVFDIR